MSFASCPDASSCQPGNPSSDALPVAPLICAAGTAVINSGSSCNPGCINRYTCMVKTGFLRGLVCLLLTPSGFSCRLSCASKHLQCPSGHSQKVTLFGTRTACAHILMTSWQDAAARTLLLAPSMTVRSRKALQTGSSRSASFLIERTALAISWASVLWHPQVAAALSTAQTHQACIARVPGKGISATADQELLDPWLARGEG